MNTQRGIAMIAVLSALTLTVGCTATEQGTTLGTVAGAGLGYAVGDSKGALIGAAVGGGTGYIAGKQVDQNRRINDLEGYAAVTRDEANRVTVNVNNSNGSYTPVTLLRSGNVYIGPRGEQYLSLPTEDQLRQVYGF